MTTLSARFVALAFFVLSGAAPARAALSSGEAHVWETQEITLRSRRREYANPYVGRECWIDLEGPGFARRVYGFWDGGRTFQVRFVATAPGEWRWRTGSNQPGRCGPERRPAAGCGRSRGPRPRSRRTPTAAASCGRRRTATRCSTPTARRSSCSATRGSPPPRGGCRWKGVRPAPDYVPGVRHQLRGGGRLPQAPGLQLGQLHRRVPQLGRRPARRDLRERRRRLPPQRLGEVRRLGAGRRDHDGRRRDHHGQGHGRRAGQPPVRGARGPRRPRRFRPPRIPPTSAASTARCGTCPSRASCRSSRRCAATPARRGRPTSISTTSYARFVQYLVARYGAYNLVFSGIHLDWIPKDYSLTADEFNAALTLHREDLRAAAVRPAVHDADRQLDLQALRPRRARARG